MDPNRKWHGTPDLRLSPVNICSETGCDTRATECGVEFEIPPPGTESDLS